MQLTKDNFKVYAAHYYDNPFCLTENEFEYDLFRSSVIKRLLTNYIVKGQTNIKLLINTTISFYNVFEHNAATNIIRFKLAEEQIEYANSVLTFLNLPTIPGPCNQELLEEIRKEYEDL